MKILLVDDHVLFREGLASLLDSQPDMQVVGHVGSVKGAVLLSRALHPDLILMDFNLQDGTGLDAAREVLQENPSIKVVFLTAHETDDSFFSAIRSGAKGFLLKNLPSSRLLVALHAIERGEVAISRGMTAKLLYQFFQTGTNGSPVNHKSNLLTTRELDILREIASGCTNQEIAGRLYISEATVKNHVHNLLKKLGLRSRQEAIKYSLQNHLGET